MRKKAGQTLVEMVLCVALTGIVLGVMAMLYGFASVRLSDIYTRNSLADQMNAVADRIETTIRSAKTCSSADAGATLNCTMPATGFDTDGDGDDDTWIPDAQDSRGNEQYNAGSHVWFYSAGETGAYHVGSGSVWSANVLTAAAPTILGLDTGFCKYYGGSPRFPLVTSLAVTVSGLTHTVTFTLTGSTRIGTAVSTSTNDSTGRSMTLTRVVSWRNYH